MKNSDDIQFNFDDATVQTSTEKMTGKSTMDFDAGISLQRHFTEKNVHPYDEIEWEFRTATITNDKGETLAVKKALGE